MSSDLPRSSFSARRSCCIAIATAISLGCSGEATDPNGIMVVDCVEGVCSSGAGGSGTGGEAATGGAVGTGGAGTSTGGTDGTTLPPVVDCTRTVSTTAYSFDANVPPSTSPPGELAVEDTPLFVSISFDDNFDAAGMQWATSVFGPNGGASFYHASTYGDANTYPGVAASWKAAYDAGLETGLHTETHTTSHTTPAFTWASELDQNISFFSGQGMSSFYGFRAPYLQYNDALFAELKKKGVWYDTTIEEGFAAHEDGSNLNWPYTLDSGSPGHEVVKAFNGGAIGFRQVTVGAHAGLFELPVYALAVPDDSVAPGLRAAMSGVPDFVGFGYKVTGFDYNIWHYGQISGEQAFTLLKYNFDQRRAGNRAPFLFGGHSNYYAPGSSFPGSTVEGRKKAIEDFIAYVQQFPEVRLVSYKEIVDFMREPKPLECY